jgi:hypothetical protein
MACARIGERGRRCVGKAEEALVVVRGLEVRQCSLAGVCVARSFAATTEKSRCNQGRIDSRLSMREEGRKEPARGEREEVCGGGDGEEEVRRMGNLWGVVMVMSEFESQWGGCVSASNWGGGLDRPLCLLH